MFCIEHYVFAFSSDADIYFYYTIFLSVQLSTNNLWDIFGLSFSEPLFREGSNFWRLFRFFAGGTCHVTTNVLRHSHPWRLENLHLRFQRRSVDNGKVNSINWKLVWHINKNRKKKAKGNNEIKGEPHTHAHTNFKILYFTSLYFSIGSLGNWKELLLFLIAA